MSAPAAVVGGSWEQEDFDLPDHIPRMITGQEVLYLHWLAREFWSGRGDVVEFGPWLGGSTFCLADGMRSNPNRSERSRLHVVDNFKWQEFMSVRAPVDLPAGATFRAEFEENLAEHRDLVQIHEARLPDEPIVEIFGMPLGDYDRDLPLFDSAMLPDAVEIVFVDGAKSWRALSHMLRQLAPRCVPQRTVLVFQDFKVTGGYWIQMGAGALLEAGALELLHVLPFNSVAFRVTGAFDAVARSLPETIREVPVERGTRLLERVEGFFASAGDPTAARLIALSRIVFLGSRDRWAQAAAEFRSIEAAWPLREHAGELERVRRWLERSPADAPLPGVRARSRPAYLAARRRLGALKRRFGR